MILKTVYSDGSELYRELPGGFHLIRQDCHMYEGTGEIKYGDQWKERYSKETSGFIVSHGGKDIYPIFENQANFVLTEAGQVFKNLTDLPKSVLTPL